MRLGDDADFNLEFEINYNGKILLVYINYYLYLTKFRKSCQTKFNGRYLKY